eukprot:TRINITY_DN40299_c0_g1_i1.p1 TRINITY_DN40299_c0_g1~~TRINITY_DN40299_c0_g1_i1.p1  ORF type:complete len:804 (-),score=104.58 TRINITY_DN40299_c0_g1_i1:41-2176(-)
MNGAELIGIDSFQAARELMFAINMNMALLLNDFWMTFRLSQGSWRKWNFPNNVSSESYSNFIIPIVQNSQVGHFCLSASLSSNGLSFSQSRCMDRKSPVVCVMNSSICGGQGSVCEPNPLLQLENVSSCSQCSAGLPSNMSLFGCMSCPPNFYISEAKCLSCPPNSYAVDVNSEYCTFCSNHQVARGFSCVCADNFFGFPNSDCSECLEMNGVSCPVNSSLPVVAPGYGRSSQDVRVATACIPTLACVYTNESKVTQCASGYQGEFCSKCEDNYYRSGLACVPCGVEAWKFATLTLIIILLVIALLRLSTFVSQIPSDVRISLAAMQLIALYPSVSHSWPQSLSTLMDVSAFANINIGFSSPECTVKASFWTAFHIKMLLPLVIVSLIIFLSISSNLIKERRPLIQTERLVQCTLFIIMISYTMQVVTLVQPFNCFQREDRKYYLYADQSIPCLDDQWNQNVKISSFYFIIYLGIVPVVISSVLFCNRQNLDNPKFVRIYSQLVQLYKKDFFYWEAVVMLRKIFLGLTFQVFGSFLSKTGQLFMIILVLFGFLFLEVVKLPCANHHDNVLNIVWMIICILLLLSNGLIFSQSDIPDSQKLAGGIVMTLVVVIAFVVCFATAVQKVVEILRAVKLQSSGGGGTTGIMAVLSVPETASPETDRCESEREIRMLARSVRSTIGDRAFMNSFTPAAQAKPVGLSIAFDTSQTQFL